MSGSSLSTSRLMEERKCWRKDHPHGFWARPVTTNGKMDLYKWEVGFSFFNNSKVFQEKKM
jgi:ubiquitin-conjugating enzyme E2 I